MASRRSDLLLLLLALLVGVGLAVIAVQFVRLSNLTSEVQAQAVAIQGQRYTATYVSCLDQNQRNEATSRLVRRDIRRALRHAHTRKVRLELRASRAQTLLLVDALAPKRDCRAYAASVVGG